MRICKRPKVYLVAQTRLNNEGVDAFLSDQDLKWPSESITSTESMAALKAATGPDTTDGQLQAAVDALQAEMDGPSDAAQLTELAGRCCYMSFGKKAGKKTAQSYIDNLIGVGRHRRPDVIMAELKLIDAREFHMPPAQKLMEELSGAIAGHAQPAHGSVLEHANFSFLVVGAGRGFCYDEDTDVLTDEGWKAWPDLRGDEALATINDDGYLEYQRPTALVVEPYKGRMYKLKSKMVDLLVTPNHRMLHQKYTGLKNGGDAKRKWEIAPAEEMMGLRVRYRRDAQWVAPSPSRISIPNFMSQQVQANQHGMYGTRPIVCEGVTYDALDFARFMGWWLAEGSLDHQPGGGYFTVIAQDERSAGFPEIEKLLTDMEMTFSIKRSGATETMRQFRVSGGRALYEYLKPHSGAKTKSIPIDVRAFNAQECRILIDAYLAGDGSFPRRGSGEGHTISEQLADDLQELALKAGWSATVREVDRRDEPVRFLNGNPIRHANLIYVVSFCKERNRPLVNHNGKRHDEWVEYDGMVYCATVPNGTLHVRRNGRPVWSGNSHEQVRHRAGWAYSQLSTRYCDFEREEMEGTWDPGFCIPPLAQLSERAALSVEEGVLTSVSEYSFLLAQIEEDLQKNPAFIAKLNALPENQRKRMLRKAARGAARDVLPIATEAIMTMTGNARAIWNTIYLRASEHAEGVIRDVYVQIARIMKDEFPEVFGGLEFVEVWDGSTAVRLPRDKL